jgi:DNA repair ATPase RecN
MRQNDLNNLARLDKLLKDKLVLFDSLKSMTKNSLTALENTQEDEFYALLDESEKKIGKINNIDEAYNEMVKSLDSVFSVKIKEISAFFRQKDTVRNFGETKLPAEFEDFYNSLYRQYFLLTELSELNNELIKRINLNSLKIKKNIEDINNKKQLNSKYNIYNFNNMI